VARHYVTNDDVSLRIFRSDFLEALTKVHWFVPHLIFLPLIAWLVVLGSRTGLGIGEQIGAFAFGALIWTLAEYLVHRFMFHAGEPIESEVREVLTNLKPGEPALGAIKGWHHVFYFFAHGIHHDYPRDSKRLVMPPSVSLPLALVFWFGFRYALGPVWAYTAFAGFMAGYLAYDTIHYAVHHFSLHSPVLLYLKKLHYRHHYGDPASDYGVSSPLWDFVFRTASPETRGGED
jgi:hypothetical protein